MIGQGHTLEGMEETVQAAYEDGVLASPEEWAEAAGDDISLDDVRHALATIRGSLSEALIDERRDR